MIKQRSILEIFVLVLVVFGHGCVGLSDSGTINEYNKYLEIYNNDSQKYNTSVNDWIEKEANYNTAYQDALDSSKMPYANVRSYATGTTSYEQATGKLGDASDQLVIAIDNYKNNANKIYTHLDEFEQFIMLNEETLKRNNVDTVQLKKDIQDWKEEIRYNLK
ncbi:MAG: hypothetical protein U9N13_01055 [Euryarchaeota archaeon]|nr:hypothetical protein [Euryarchaeota archaeon]